MPPDAETAARLGAFDTALSPDQEAAFQLWKQQYAPRDSGMDYDLRGAFQAGLMPDPQTGHWSDQFKKPNHPTFSVESQYAQGRPAGHWQGEQYIPPQQAEPPGLGSNIMSALGMGMRGLDIPRQALLHYSAGLPIGDSLGQVMDPAKVLSGADVVKRQLPGLIESSPAGATALGSLLDFADPLVALGAVPRGLSAAVGLGEVGAVGKNIKGAARGVWEGASKMISPQLAEYDSVTKVPLQTVRDGIRGWITPEGKVLGSRALAHEDIAMAGGLVQGKEMFSDALAKGGIRYVADRGGGLAMELDTSAPNSMARARRLMEEFAPRADYVTIDAWTPTEGLRTFQGDSKGANRFLENVNNPTTAPKTLEEGLTHAYEEGKAATKKPTWSDSPFTDAYNNWANYLPPDELQQVRDLETSRKMSDREIMKMIDPDFYQMLVDELGPGKMSRTISPAHLEKEQERLSQFQLVNKFK